MTTRVRSYVTAGIAAVAAGAIAIAPTVAAPPAVTVSPKVPVASQVSQARVALLAAAQRLTLAVDPEAAAATAASPAPLNAASDFIVAAWNAALPWIDYGVNLTDYVLGFIPYGYLVGDQISIVYYSLVRPVANTFVVDLVAPVVNAPLNINSYVNGLVALGSVTVTSLINLGINEFNYFFGWLIPPIPPIGLAAETAAAELTATSLAAPTPAEAMPSLVKHSSVKGEVPADEAVAVAAAAVPKDDGTVKGPKEPKGDAVKGPTATTSSATGVAAQGEVRGAQTSETAEPKRVPNGNADKKGDNGPAAASAPGSSASASNDDTGAKPDNKAGAGKKE
jgi:hypothetical protein